MPDQAIALAPVSATYITNTLKISIKALENSMWLKGLGSDLKGKSQWLSILAIKNPYIS